MTTSHSSSRYYRSAEGQPGSVVWFISFGDLLTLLLCFFLVLTPWDRLKEAGKSKSVQASTSTLSVHQQHGTTFASDLPLRGSVVKHELPIFARELEMDDAVMFGILEKELVGISPSHDRIEVLVCSPTEERARVVYGLGEVFKRVVAKDVSVRFLVTPRCDAHAVLVPVTEQYLGRIRILGM
jgi:hypothetical protein